MKSMSWGKTNGHGYVCMHSQFMFTTTPEYAGLNGRVHSVQVNVLYDVWGGMQSMVRYVMVLGVWGMVR